MSHDDDTCPHLVRANLLEAENARLKAEFDLLKIDCWKLREQNARLKAAGDILMGAYCMGDRNKERWAEYPVVREWLAAKGELP